MNMVEKAMEMRAVKRADLIGYFIKINGKETENGRIAGDGWEVEIGQDCIVPLGSFLIPEVRVVIRCREDLFDRMYEKFRMEFFRAGG